jgi:hypothetical protein
VIRLQFGTRLAPAAVDAIAAVLPARRDELERLLSRCKLGVEISLAAIKPKHTSEQQGYYWMSLHAFGAWCGYEKRWVDEMLHPLICCEAYGVARHIVMHWHGTDLNWPVPVATSSHDEHGNKRDRESYSELIEALIRFAAEQGYIIPPPIERRGP